MARTVVDFLSHHPTFVRRIIFALSFLCLPPAAIGAEKAGHFALVSDGRAASTIVTATNPSENARAAALELQKYVRQLSGAELAITNEEHAPTGPLVLIGSNSLTARLTSLSIPSGRTPQLREEGFVIS